MGDEALGPGQAVARAALLGARPEGRRVRTARRLGERIRAQPLAGEEAGKVRGLEVLGAELVYAEGRQMMDGQRHGQREEPGGELLQNDQVDEGRLAASAEALLVEDAGEAHLPELPEQLPGKLLLLLVSGRRRRGALGDEPPHRADDLLLILGESEVPVHAPKRISGISPRLSSVAMRLYNS